MMYMYYTKEDGVVTDFISDYSNSTKYDWDFERNIVEWVDDSLFHIHNGRKERRDTETARCAECGSDKFYVGKGSYFTAIKCVNCEWEVCIHEG